TPRRPPLFPYTTLFRSLRRRDDQVPELRGDDARLVIELRMDEARPARKRALAQVQGDARVAFVPVPEAPVPRKVAERDRNVLRRGLDLLEADDVGRLALDPFQDFGRPGADPVHVPGGDLQHG